MSLAARGLMDQTRETRNHALAVALFMVSTYSMYAIFADDTVSRIGDEDGVIEYLTALFFLAASLFFVKTFLSKKNGWFLLLSMVFFVGCGEEVSWGQRIFNFITPDFLAGINAQDEMNIHNIDIVNAKGKTGIAKLYSIEFLYKSFWFTYGVLLPIAALRIRSVVSLAKRARLPLPPVPIGIFFLANWLIFRVTLSYIVPPYPYKNMLYYRSIIESMECVSAFIFMTLSIYFYRHGTVRSRNNGSQMK